jgi:hypothetical protein
MMTPAEAKKAAAKAKRESLEASLAFSLRAHKLDGGMVRQYRPFDDVRYAFDFAWPDRDPIVLVEVQGGIWSGGAHVRPQGVLRDMDKLNRCAVRGWAVIQVSAEHIKSGQAVEWIRQALQLSSGQDPGV